MCLRKRLKHNCSIICSLRQTWSWILEILLSDGVMDFQIVLSYVPRALSCPTCLTSLPVLRAYVLYVLTYLRAFASKSLPFLHALRALRGFFFVCLAGFLFLLALRLISHTTKSVTDLRVDIFLTCTTLLFQV